MACLSLKRSLNFDNDSTPSSFSGGRACKRRKLNLSAKLNRQPGIASKISTENISTNSQNDELIFKGNKDLLHNATKSDIKTPLCNIFGELNTFDEEYRKHSAIEPHKGNKLKKNPGSEKTSSESNNFFDKGGDYLTLKQVEHICKNVVGKMEITLKEKYNHILIKNMEEQNESFVKFVEAQLKQYKTANSFENYFS